MPVRLAISASVKIFWLDFTVTMAFIPLTICHTALLFLAPNPFDAF
jgi:hypothetical protein